MGDLVWAKKIFFSKPLVIESSSPAHNSVRFFSRIIIHEWYFFQCRKFFPQVFPCNNFFPLEISLQDIFSGNHLYPTSKVKWQAP